MKEIVIIMGIQGAGKSTEVSSYTRNGYVRFNRDDIGGNLASLNQKVEDAIKGGTTKIVLDNTYPLKVQRAEIIQLGKKYGIPVKCVWKKTSIEDAQFNVANRILHIAAYKNPKVKPDEVPISEAIKSVNPSQVLGPNMDKYVSGVGIIPTIALFSYKKTFEKPTMAEGFSSIEEVPFVRLPSTNTAKAIICDYDGTLRDTISGAKYPTDPSDVKILPNRRETLLKYKAQGYLLLGVSNQSGVEKGDLHHNQAVACFDKTNELLGLDIDVQFCPHHSFPIRCYCRKPLPGLGVYMILKYALNPSACVFVGNATSDKTFSQRSGFQYQDEKDFFK